MLFVLFDNLLAPNLVFQHSSFSWSGHLFVSNVFQHSSVGLCPIRIMTNLFCAAEDASTEPGRYEHHDQHRHQQLTEMLPEIKRSTLEGNVILLACSPLQLFSFGPSRLCVKPGATQGLSWFALLLWPCGCIFELPLQRSQLFWNSQASKETFSK